MGHDEDKNSFDAGAAKPITSQPRTNITGNNRLGMRSGRNISAAQAELDRISADSNPNAVPSTATGDIVLNNPAPKGKKSPKIIILAVLVVLAVVAAVVSVVVTRGNNGGNGGDGSNSQSTESTAKNTAIVTLEDFASDYGILVEGYETRIGSKFDNFVMNEASFVMPILPAGLEQFQEALKTTKEKFAEVEKISKINDISEDKQKQFDSIKTNVKKNIETIDENLSILEKFSNAYTLPIYNHFMSGEAIACQESKEIKELKADSSLKSSADEYYKIYCDIANTYANLRTAEELKFYTDEASNSAAKNLTNTLKTIDNYETDNIKKFIEGIK